MFRGYVSLLFPVRICLKSDVGLSEAVVLSWKRNANGALCEDKVVRVQNVFWSVDSCGGCLPDVVSHMHHSQHTYLEVYDILFASSAVVNAYNGKLDAEGDWDFSYILSSGELDIPTSLRRVSLIFLIGGWSTRFMF